MTLNAAWHRAHPLPRDASDEERLRWHTWDVRDLLGKHAVIEVVDRRTGGWGHINVDQIVQGDAARQAAPARRELRVASRYLVASATCRWPKANRNPEVIR